MSPPKVQLLLFSGYLLSLSDADLCSSETRVAIKTRECRSHRTLIQLPFAHANPYHAMHDNLWTVSHYVSKCIIPPLTINVTYSVRDLDSCERPGSTLPWDVCVTYAVARTVNASITDSASGCYSEQVYFGGEPFSRYVDGPLRSDFRGLSWYGCRHCSPKTTLEPLATSEKVDALANLRGAVFDMIGTPRREMQRRIRVLLYDRADARTRIWVNANAVFERLRENDAVEVNYVQAMPTGLWEQANLYAWADIVLAPHGAAMANTMFMRAGAEVLEIWKDCTANITNNPDLPREWTEWHAAPLGIGLKYLQCYAVDKHPIYTKAYRGRDQSETRCDSHKVELTEVFNALEKAVERQQNRLIVLGEDISHFERRNDPLLHVSHGFLNVVSNEWQVPVLSRVLLPLFASCCIAVLILSSRVMRGSFHVKRVACRKYSHVIQI